MAARGFLSSIALFGSKTWVRNNPGFDVRDWLLLTFVFAMEWGKKFVNLNDEWRWRGTISFKLLFSSNRVDRCVGNSLFHSLFWYITTTLRRLCMTAHNQTTRMAHSGTSNTHLMSTTKAIILEYICPALGVIAANVMISAPYYDLLRKAIGLQKGTSATWTPRPGHSWPEIALDGLRPFFYRIYGFSLPIVQFFFWACGLI